jgi:hypothetical protein
MYYAGAFAKGASSNYARLYQDMTTTNGNHNYYVGAWVKSGIGSGTVEVCLNDVARQASISCQTKTVGGNWIRFAFQTKTPSSTIPGNPNGTLTTRLSIKTLTTTGGYFFTDDAVVVDRTECGDSCQPSPWN